MLIYFFIAFSFGYARGRKKGYLEGETEGLIKLKQAAYLTGKCSVCTSYVQGKPYLITNNNNYQREEEQLSDQGISAHM